MFCRLPLHYFGIDEKATCHKAITPRRDPIAGNRSRANSILKSNSPLAYEKPAVEKNIANLWHSFGSLAHLRQAGFHRPASHEFFMHMETPDSDIKATNAEIILPPTLTQSSSTPTANPHLSKLITRLLGIDYPDKIRHELILFIRDLYTKHTRPIKSYSEFLTTKLAENIVKQSDDNFYWLLAALHCAPSELFCKNCETHISHFATKLALLFMALDHQQQGLSSKVIAATADRSSCLAATLFSEFKLSEEFANAESREIAVRLKTVFLLMRKSMPICGTTSLAPVMKKCFIKSKVSISLIYLCNMPINL